MSTCTAIIRWTRDPGTDFSRGQYSRAPACHCEEPKATRQSSAAVTSLHPFAAIHLQ
jgi:hypothetical protein